MEMRCPSCNSLFNLDEETGVLFIFTRAPEYSHVRIRCPFDQCDQAISLVLDEDDVEKMVALDLPTMVEESPSDAVEAQLAPKVTVEDKPVSPSGPYELTVGQEIRLERFSTMLASLPDEWLMEVMSHPPPRCKLPHTWPDTRSR